MWRKPDSPDAPTLEAGRPPTPDSCSGTAGFDTRASDSEPHPDARFHT
jgi:hypothetical protein